MKTATDKPTRGPTAASSAAPAPHTVWQRLAGLWSPTRLASGYDAAKTTPRRKVVSSTLKDEDSHLTPAERNQLLANHRDLQRNFSLAGWIIRKHLDFVATHSFHAQTGDKALDAELEAFIKERSQRENFDAAGRHNAARFFRMAEARRIIDGDIFFLKLRGGQLQAIEADRVRDPGRLAIRGTWRHGVRVGQAGKALAYAIHRRHRWGGFVFEKTVDAARAIHFATYDGTHRFDATRGVSPVASAINDLRDLYEAKDYALTKIKISQLLGLIIKSDADEGLGLANQSATETIADKDGDEEDDTADRYDVTFGKGPYKLELEPGDAAEIIETGTPAVDSQKFMTFCLAVAMKAVDLPYNFFDEKHTNFFGSKAAITLYLKSARSKREDHQEARHAWHSWQFRAADARRELPRPSTMTADELAALCVWIPAGVPWLDMGKELAGDMTAVEAGLRTRAEIRRERYGDDIRDVWRALEQEQKELEAHGLWLGRGGKPQPPQPPKEAPK